MWRASDVATFLAERYWPGVTSRSAEAASSRVTATSEATGTDTTVLDAILAHDDEVCLWYVEAASAADVAALFRAAAVPLDRITPAARLPVP